MRTAAWGILAAGVLAGLMQTGAALACGATAPPFYVVTEQAPTSAAAPLNTPIVVTLGESADGPVVEGFNPSLTLTKAGSDIAIALKSLGGPPNLAWVPLESLEPETTYEAHFNPGYEGIPDTIWPFTTGKESTPALSLEGELEVTFEAGTETFYSCPTTLNTCGTNDKADCTRQDVEVTKARVKLPRALDGFAKRSGVLWLTDDMPFDFSPGSKTAPPPYQGRNVSRVHYADLDGPSVVDVLITVPSQEEAYQPCFAFAASDARGDQATSAPLCVDLPAVPVVVENDADPLANDIERSGTSKGCSFGAQRASCNNGWLAALALVALVRRRRATLSAARRP